MDRGAWPATVREVAKESDTTEATKPQQQHTSEPLRFMDFLYFACYTSIKNEKQITN